MWLRVDGRNVRFNRDEPKGRSLGRHVHDRILTRRQGSAATERRSDRSPRQLSDGTNDLRDHGAVATQHGSRATRETFFNLATNAKAIARVSVLTDTARVLDLEPRNVSRRSNRRDAASGGARDKRFGPKSGNTAGD